MNLQDLEEQYQEDMQQAELEGKQFIEDAEDELIDDLLLKLTDIEKQIFEAKNNLNRFRYDLSHKNIVVALKKIQEVKDVVFSNCS